jgi:hypothetical protein
VEDTRFDHLAKVFGSPTTRRRILSTVLGGALGLLGVAETAAYHPRCTPKCDECQECRAFCRKTKRGRKVCRRGTCLPAREGAACRFVPGATCHNGICVCPIGQERCDGLCFGLCPVGQRRDLATCGCLPS